MTPSEIQQVMRDVSRSQSFQRGIQQMNTSRINADNSSTPEEQERHTLQTKKLDSNSNIFEESQQVYVQEENFNLLDENITPAEYFSSEESYEEEHGVEIIQNFSDPSEMLP
jgi:hypothetical protein